MDVKVSAARSSKQRMRRLASVLLAIGLAACSSGGVAPKLSSQRSDAELTGEPKCVAASVAASKKSEIEPLIVEWPSTSRAKLEAMSRKGLVVVSYHACEMQVLGQCRVSGNYVYTAITRKRDRVKMKDESELYANVPLGAASLEAMLKKAGELNVAMTIVGRFEAERATVRRDELVGDCDDATHVVTAMVAGAFDFFAGTDSEVGGGAKVLGAGASAKSSSSFERLNSDGDEAKCGNATLADKSPPDGCGALLRLELLTIGAAKPVESACPEKTTWEPRLQLCVMTEQAVTEAECPNGTTLTAEGCVKSAPSTPSTTSTSPVPKGPGGCRYGDATDCTVQCEMKSDPASCTDLALMFVKGEGVTADAGKVAKYYARACDLGSALGCNQAGMRFEDGDGVTKDDVKAAALYDKACEAGKGEGCTNLARMFANGWGVGKDDTHAAEVLTRACNLGDPGGCSNLGFFYIRGRGVGGDYPRGVALLRKGCLGGNKWGCDLLKKLNEKP